MVGLGSGTEGEGDGRVWLELPHEAVIRHWRTLAGWIDAERDGLRFGRRAQEAAEAWRRAKRPRGGLWRSPDLDLLRRFAARGGRPLTGLQAEFLAASERQAGRERRLARSAVGAIAVLSLLAGGLAWRSTERANEAERRTREAEAERARADRQSEIAGRERDIAFRARVVLRAADADRHTEGGDATTGLLLALEPLVSAPAGAPRGLTAEAERAARQALAELREASVMRVSDAGRRGTVLFSPDLGRATSLAGDGVVRVWDTVNGTEISAVALQDFSPEHAGASRAITLSPDGRYAAATRASDARRITRFWETASGRVVAAWPGSYDPRLPPGVGDQRFPTDGQYLSLFDTEQRNTRLALAHTGQWVGDLRARVLAFAPSGQMLLGSTHANDKRVMLLDPATGKQVELQDRGARGHLWATVDVFAFSPDGKRVASMEVEVGAPNGNVVLWNAESGSQIAQLRKEGAAPHSVAFSPDGRFLAASFKDWDAVVWEADTGRRLAALRNGDAPSGGKGTDENTSDVAFTPDGGRVATAAPGNGVRVWDVAKEREILTLRGHTGPVAQVSVSPDGARLGTVALDGTARTWDLGARGAWAALDVAHSAGFARLQMRFSNDDRALWSWAAGPGENELLVVDPSTGRASATVLSRGGSDPLHLELSPDGRYGAALMANDTVRLFDFQAGRQTAVLPARGGRGFRKAVFSPDGGHLAVLWGGNRAAGLWEVPSGREVPLSLAHVGVILELWFSPGGLRVASTSEDEDKHGPETVRVWDAGTGAEVFTLGGPGRGRWRPVVSPDGRRAVVVPTDQAAGAPRLLDLEAGGREVKALTREEDTRGMEFSRGLLVSRLPGGTLRLLDADTGQELATLAGADPGRVVYSPAASFVATAGRDAVRMWDASTGREFAALRLPTPGPPNLFAVTADGRRIMTADRSPDRRSPILVHDIAPSGATLVEAAASRLARCLSPKQLVLQGLADAGEVDPTDARPPPPPCRWHAPAQSDGQIGR